MIDTTLTHSEQMQDSIEPIIHNKKEVILIGSDHRGFDLKGILRKHLIDLHYDVMDVGTHDKDKCDYPMIAKSLVKTMDHKKGILICGSGFGMSISANRNKGVHAVTPRTVEECKTARQHGDINVLCIGSDFTSDVESIRIVDAFLNTKFSGEERHLKRIKMIDE